MIGLNKLGEISALVIIYFVALGAKADELKFISMDIVPWAYFDKKENKYAGIFPDLVHEFERRTGHDIKITLSPYARINRELETGRQDCTMLITQKDRNEVITLGELVVNLPIGVIADKNIQLNGYEDLYGMKISLLRGASISERFNKDKRLSKSFDTDYLISLRKIAYGRLDAVAGAIPTIQTLAKENGMGSLLGNPLQLKLEPIYLQCSKKSKNLELIKDINMAMKDIRESHVLNDIILKYWTLPE